MWSRIRSVRCLSKLLTPLDLQVPRVFYEVHAFIVEQYEHAAILSMKTGGVSSLTLVRLFHFFYRIVVERQRKSYCFLITPQPTVAMLHRGHLREGGFLIGGWAMWLLGSLDAPMRVPMVGAQR
jgi:hypothetical protein